MTVCGGLIIALWVVLVAYWVIASRDVKSTIRGDRVWRREIALRVAMVAVIVAAVRLSLSAPAPWRMGVLGLRQSTALGLVGVVLCAAGAGLAVAARLNLRRNWGMPMARKQDPELVTSGPYAYIRHPIYSGMILGMLGSAIGLITIWAVPLVIYGGYFIYSARREERLMTMAFPETYPEYMKRTWMLVPFVF
jgi:protein-S-isoprenylcysteine O-methyltransferase Ste14